MKKLIDTYRGARIYEVEQVDESKGQKVGIKLIAKALLPDSNNLETDFVEEGQGREDTLQKIRKDIDQYLNKHNLARFVNIDQRN